MKHGGGEFAAKGESGMKDIHDKIEVAELIAPAVLDADNTPVGADLANFEAAEIVLQVGVGGITFDSTNKIEFKLLHSDDNETYAAVASSDLVGSPIIGTGGIIKSLTSAHAAATVDQYGYIGGKRYVELLADFSGTHGTGTPVSALVVKGRPHQMS